MVMKQSGADPIKLFFSLFPFFAVKQGHLAINYFFSICNKHASLPVKNEKKFFVSEEIKFYRIGY